MPSGMRCGLENSPGRRCPASFGTTSADPDGYILFQLYPETWQLPKVGPVGMCVCWNNPFEAEPEDFSIRIPWNWTHAKDLKEAVTPHVPEGFTDVTDRENLNQNDAFWRYIQFQDYIANSRFDVDAFYQAILTAFRDLLSLRPTIDAYLSKCGEAMELRTARRELGIVAVVDTETAGAEQELIELAIVNAAYDKQSGELLGIIEQYESLREPKCKISRSNQRLNGLRIQEVRGRRLDEERVKALFSEPILSLRTTPPSIRQGLRRCSDGLQSWIGVIR